MSEQRVNLNEAKVLVVDDQPDNLELLCRSLEAAGCSVQVASSGQVALQIATRAAPDLILLDVMMPMMDGYETCRKLKEGETTKDIPVIFLTAHHDVQGIAEGFRAGGVDYITKPFQKDELLVRINNHVERGRLARELADKSKKLEELNERVSENLKKSS